jgi:hypothetical protein
MPKNTSKKNEQKLRLFLAQQEKKNDIKTNHTKVNGISGKPQTN